MRIVERCPGKPEGMGDFPVDGVNDDQHQYVEGEPYEAQGPVGSAPVRHEPIVCERCGVVEDMWRRIQGPPGVFS